MLARSAQGLYWMGRYLERAEHLSRLLRLQAEALVDRSPREIYFGWARIYHSIDRRPPGDVLEEGDDPFTLADSYTLADDLTFDRNNPDSVWSCFARGRENARQTRNCISTEMWARLNLAYLRMQQQSIREIWGSPEGFYSETVAEVATFLGVAQATMYRDEGWSFLQIGRFVERAQLASSLLRTQLAIDTGTAEESEADWTSLLRAYHAFEAYDRRYTVEVQPRQVLELLVTEPLLPDSLRRSIDTLAAEFAAVGPGPDRDASGSITRLLGRMATLVDRDWLEGDDQGQLLGQLSTHARDVHHLVATAYFDYPVEDFRTR